jgi:predicted nucleotide-binding protein
LANRKEEEVIRKPKVFIGSARESINYVNAIQEQLSYCAEVTPWSAGAFRSLEYPMEALERELTQNDFAIFVFSPDDVVNIRGVTSFITRDNTLFEMGLFWGRLKRGRVFYLIPDTTPDNDDVKGLRLPSDLEALTVLTYQVRSDHNYNAAVNVACGKIQTIIEEMGFFQDPAVLLKEALETTEQDYAIIRLLRTLSKHLLDDPTQKYEYLSEAVRSTYKVPTAYFVEGIGIWLKEEHQDHIGLRQVAGNEGQGKFYDFGVNADKEQSDRIVVVDCLLNSEELVLLKHNTSFDKKYVLCYPIGNEIVLTVAIAGRDSLTENEIDKIFLDNHKLLGIINYLFGGAST